VKGANEDLYVTSKVERVVTVLNHVLKGLWG